MENNKAHVIGTICSPFEYSYTVLGEDFYLSNISVLRTSNAADIVPVMVSARTVDVKQDMTSFRIEVIGNLRSYSKRGNEKNTLLIYLWPVVFRETDLFDLNEININGFLCRTPIYRSTPYGREITDMLLAVNRPYGKSDYIPSIAWGRNAHYLSSFETGGQVEVSGRLQSRQYIKIIDGIAHDRIAYELSVTKLFDGGCDYGSNNGYKGISETEILQ